MERKLALWVGVPFLGVAWTLIAVVALVPGLINSRLPMLLLLVLSGTGVLIMVIRIYVRGRANSFPSDTLYPIAGILVAIGVGFHAQVAELGRDILAYVTPGNLATEGMRFARAEDGQFHIRLTVTGSEVDFAVELASPFNVLMPDVPRRIGINPSSLIYDQRVELAAGAGAEYAADVVLPKVRLGTAVIENLPVKVFATQRSRNVLGKPFLERLKSWRVDGDTLIIVQ